MCATWRWLMQMGAFTLSAYVAILATGRHVEPEPRRGDWTRLDAVTLERFEPLEFDPAGSFDPALTEIPPVVFEPDVEFQETPLYYDLGCGEAPVLEEEAIPAETEPACFAVTTLSFPTHPPLGIWHWLRGNSRPDHYSAFP